MKRYFLLLAALSLVACANETNYREKVDAWIGKKESELVASEWGPPHKTYDLEGGSRVLSYTKTVSSGGVFPMMGIGIGSGGGGGGIGIGATTFGTGAGGGRFCETNFTVVDGIITDASFQGDGCTS
jgi:hypothetical protein